MSDIINIVFKRSCSACPEQYDIYTENSSHEIGLVHLRHGYFSVSNRYDETVFGCDFPLEIGDDDIQPEEFEIIGANPDGGFDSDEQRDAYLSIAARFIAQEEDMELGDYRVEY